MRICPTCDKPLVALEYRNVEVDWCPACRGIWMDRGELGVLLRGDPAADALIPLSVGARSPRRCPACGDWMREARAQQAPITLDVCPHDHGWWFDEGEVKAVTRTIADDRALAQLTDFYESLFGHPGT
ncbi:MAG: zf-TFIIB domain-containing protein [Kiritimatiellae bacterium]|nr:zf-TFIIB domain-containing protein [Kiritimatiellia bacterium]MDW8459031.1 zf-TFIIB domain-containing protein [Verrucomicrobiota bacterium]